MPLTIRLRAARTDDPQLLEAVRIVRAGGLVVFPTETVYGLGALLGRPGAAERIRAAKDRPGDLPLLVHCADTQDIAPLVGSMPAAAMALIQTFLPGPLALVLPAGNVPADVRGPGNTVGIRVVAHPVGRALIRLAGSPLLGTSANRHGDPATGTYSALDPALLAGTDLVIDAGTCGSGTASTILDLTTDPPRLLREGAIARADIERVAGVKIANPT